MRRREFLRRVSALAAAGLPPQAIIPALGEANRPSGEILGMYVIEGYPYRRPYSPRTWTVEDFRGYADGLKKLGYNTLLIWQELETMPSPLTPSDRENLKTTATVIDVLHHEFGMQAWIVLTPNISVNDQEAAKESFITGISFMG